MAQRQDAEEWSATATPSTESARLPGLRRRTWALAYTGQGLRWRVALAAGYYNFCRTHQALCIPLGEAHCRGRTPAMALGVTGHCWSVREFLLHPVYESGLA